MQQLFSDKLATSNSAITVNQMLNAQAQIDDSSASNNNNAAASAKDNNEELD